MFNKVIIAGNLTRDIELRYLPSGTAVGNTGIASTRKFKGSDGEQKEEVLFVDITFFGRTAEIANQYLRKGSKVLIEGRLKLDSWTDQNGGKRSKHTVVVENMQMLDSRSSGDSQPSQSYSAPQNEMPPAQTDRSVEQKPANDIPSIDIDDDEIPF
jgi:single-strand DNA-binding protein